MEMDARNRLETPIRGAWLSNGRFAKLIFLGLVIFSVLGIYFWSSGPRDPLKIVNEKIEMGMSTQEARGIVLQDLGIVKSIDVPVRRGRDQADGRGQMTFYSDQGVLVIDSMDDQVVKKVHIERVRVSVFDRVRRWLGW